MQPQGSCIAVSACVCCLCAAAASCCCCDVQVTPSPHDQPLPVMKVLLAVSQGSRPRRVPAHALLVCVRRSSLLACCCCCCCCFHTHPPACLHACLPASRRGPTILLLQSICWQAVASERGGLQAHGSSPPSPLPTLLLRVLLSGEFCLDFFQCRQDMRWHTCVRALQQ